jgi:hypothetical protein
MAMNELLDKDTSTMSTPELVEHVNKTILEIYNITEKQHDKFGEIFEKGSWNDDNQSPGIRASVMALYNLHVGEGTLEIKKADTGREYTVTRERKNPINFYSHGGSGHHSFNAYDLAKFVNYSNNPKDITFELKIDELPTMATEAEVKGRRFVNAYTLMILACHGERWGGNRHAHILSETILKTDRSLLYDSSIYGERYGTAQMFGINDPMNVYTLAHANPVLGFTSMREYIISDAIKQTAFVNFVNPSEKPKFVAVSGNLELLKDYWADWKARNYHRLRDEFIKETYDTIEQGLRETLDAQLLGKAI